ncbi:hypothetical protein Tsubulata_025442 [Turnera subulata]|uniref:Pectinesterase inhibitor domain-containing protein n=1 Tax=Turnera subulata TaxID=218843 RepID=A0A9Q0J544_9ROSI|nr:hypothetical protein Tsubulata_025442 [Turnera subulata]
MITCPCSPTQAPYNPGSSWRRLPYLLTYTGLSPRDLNYILKVAKELRATKAKERQIVKDCLDQISEWVDQLCQSIREVHALVAPRTASDDVFWHISNVETWVSAALTDARTCAAQFPGRNMSKVQATYPRRQSRAAAAYIQASCNKTSYPALCMHYLSMYANSSTIPSPLQLTQVALSVSLNRAQSTSSYISKVLRATKGKERQILEDCLDLIGFSTDSLGDSIREVHALVSPRTPSDDVLWHISNVETWVCDAMDCVTDCTDGGPDEKKRKFKGTMKRKLLNAEQSVTIVLDLFDQYAGRYYKP